MFNPDELMKSLGEVASDIIVASGPVSELPNFLFSSWLSMYHRLRATGLWENFYGGQEIDMRFHFPHKYTTEFIYLMSDLSPARIEFREDCLLLGGLRAELQPYQYHEEVFYFAIYNVGQTCFIQMDDTLQRWLFRAPWAIARFEVKDVEPT
jgi:hypothetical protein